MYSIENLKLCQLEELSQFMAASNFLRNDAERLRYIVEVLSRKVEDNIVVTYNGRIVGCNLYLHALASINGELRPIRWSHSTYLEKEHRKYIGIEFFVNSYSIDNTWGFGLTETNHKIHELNGTTFCGESKGYFVNPFCIPPVRKVISGNKESQAISKYIIPMSFKLHGRTFIKCFSDEDHKISDGFFNPHILNVDFVRNREFLKKRFYDYLNKYHVYKVLSDSNEDEGYYVFKIQYINGLPAIFLVDYRFNLSDSKGLSCILDSLCYIAAINSLCSIYLFTTLPTEYIDANYASISPYGSRAAIITNSAGVTENSLIMVTPADSDCELFPV